MFNATKRSRLRIFQKLLTGWNHNGVVVSPYVSSASTGRTLHSDSADLDVKLYQYTICPFCNKAKALLAYADIDYSAIEVNPLTKAEIKWSKEYRKVPILTVNKQNLFGSDEILHGLLEHDFVKRRLEQKWEGMQSSLADFQNESAKKWIKFSNDELAPLLYPNICRTLSDSYTAFGYVQSVDTFTPFQKIVIRGIGSLAMYLAASKIKKKRNITDERQALENSIVTLEREGLGNYNFLSGKDEPHLGDIAVYGTLRGIEGLPALDRVVFQRDGALASWYERMKHKVNK